MRQVRGLAGASPNLWAGKSGNAKNSQQPGSLPVGGFGQSPLAGLGSVSEPSIPNSAFNGTRGGSDRPAWCFTRTP